MCFIQSTLPMKMFTHSFLLHKVDHSPPPSAEVKYVWSYISTPSICLHAVALKQWILLYGVALS